MNNIFLRLQSDPRHAEEECDDADAGRLAAEPEAEDAEPRQRTLSQALSREKNSPQRISAALCQGAAVGLSAASHSHLITHLPHTGITFM